MTHTITIAGKPFTVQPKYSEGHVLTANEASTLNQTYYENLRNNFAKEAKEGKDQSAFDEYVSKYAFGTRVGGTVSRDPIEVEAMELARNAIRKAITNAGKKVADFSAKVISSKAAELVASKPEYRELARQRVAEMQKAASDTLSDDILAGLDAAQAEANAKGEENGEAEGSETEGTEEGSTEGKTSEEPAAEQPSGRGRRRG